MCLSVHRQALLLGPVEKCACARVTPYPPRPHTFVHQPPQPARTIPRAAHSALTTTQASPRRLTTRRHARVRQNASGRRARRRLNHAGAPRRSTTQAYKRVRRWAALLLGRPTSSAWNGAADRLHGSAMAGAPRDQPRSHPGQAPENRALYNLRDVVVGRASVCVCMSVGASTCVCVCACSWVVSLRARFGASE